MPPDDDKPEGPNGTLPRPELNPLLNPVLGAHMGRWAEVYFTSPPEKREEAVLQLLRELEGGTSQAPKQAGNARSEATVTCPACGQINPAQNKFCGMCAADIQPVRLHDFPIVDPGNDVNGRQSARDTEESPTFVRFPQDTADFLRENLARDDGPKLLSYVASTRYGYRVYVGTALTILLIAAVYMGWHRTKVRPGSLHTQPPAASPLNPAVNSAPPAVTMAEHNLNVVPSTAVTPDHPTGTLASPSKVPEAAQGPTQALPTTPQSPRENGFDELAMAEAYLSGTQGKAHDSSEAAKWLWKSVAKENSSAALMLSDLYLRGDGVAKSCDQARLLLDAAAKKGVTGASERLRNLPAFGCQ